MAKRPATEPTPAAIPITRRCRRPNGTMPSPQASSPPNTIAIDAVTSERLTVNPVLAVFPVWLLLMIWSSKPAARLDVGPTWNVNAACTGCESAETTRQSTTYDPFLRGGRSTSTTAPSPLGCRAVLMSIDAPVPSNRRIAPSEISTGSLNFNVMCAGAVSSTAPGCGSLDSSSA